MKLDIEHFKKLLDEEYLNTKNILDSVGLAHVDDKNDYDATIGELDVDTSEREGVASKLENMETRASIEAEAEKRLAEIIAAQNAISNGTYGRCVVCGNDIPVKRLEINPIAITCAACYGSLDISSKI